MGEEFIKIAGRKQPVARLFFFQVISRVSIKKTEKCNSLLKYCSISFIILFLQENKMQLGIDNCVEFFFRCGT